MFKKETLGIVLRVVYMEMIEGNKVVGPSQLLKKLGIPKSTAQKILLKVAELGYGTYISGKGFIMNEKGIIEAERILRKHRLLECLMEEVGVREEKICSEARKIDLFAGDELIAALERRYGRREYCPCGNRIPPQR
jgi:DtxR family Mn-dependent transcriptional regulator